jgi:hypothetical protein
MHPTFWLQDHLLEISNEADDASAKRTEFNHDFDLNNDKEAALSEKDNHAAILEQADNLDTELDAFPLSQLTYQSLIQQFEVLAHLVVQSDRNSLASVSKMIQTVTGWARNGMSISAHFNTMLGPTMS